MNTRGRLIYNPSPWADAAALQLVGGQLRILWLGHGFFRGAFSAFGRRLWRCRSLDFVRADRYRERPWKGQFRLPTQAYVLLELHSRRTSTWAKGRAALSGLFIGDR